MSTPPVYINAQASLKEIIELIITHQISTIPVLDRAGSVTGTISWHEIFPRAKKVWSPDVRIPVLFNQSIDIEHIVSAYTQSSHLAAKDIMSDSPLCVDVEDDFEHVVWVMSDETVDMIPVLNDSILVGVITRSDIMRFIVKEL